MKKGIIIALSIILPFVFTSCIERYYLGASNEDFVPRLAIDGIISNDNEIQEIVISQSSSPENPQFLPLDGCAVQVEDSKGNVFVFSNSVENKGHYLGRISGNYFVAGTSFRLKLSTTEGKVYFSKFEELTPCPEVGAVYYEKNAKPTTDPKVDENGLQFYIDFVGEPNSGRFFRWKLEETYEYHSTWPIRRVLTTQGFVNYIKADYSKFVCYKTEDVPDIFTVSTLGLSQNSFKRYPLHFVNDQTQRLMFKYSLLVKQYSITETAYQYWENLKKNNKEAVDLFGKQPAQVKGNIFNVSDSTEVVLGYFGVSSVTTRRIIIPGVTDFSFHKVSFCRVTKPDGMSMLPDERPLYWAQGFDENGQTFWNYSDTQCFICTLLGGTTDKPPYWDAK
jgi:hypothetical protein